ncbi:MAG: NAD(P)H-dependent oxidoreductase, partial [Burkholderiales bacterium]|nr:NAD(P)H-dependent oxidoreductase [Burkholderiales bacterium]
VYGRYDSAAVRNAAELVDWAWAVVVATPIYKAAAAGVLKAFFDLLPQNALADKVVLPIGVGGSRAHLLAVDYTLKPVLQTLGAQQVLGTVYAVDSQIGVGSDGGWTIDEDIALRLHNAVRRLVHLGRAMRPATPHALHHDLTHLPAGRHAVA